MNTMFKKISIFVMVLLLVGLIHPQIANAAPVVQESADALDAALAYLSTQQLDDGGIAGLSGVSDTGTTARAVLALAVNGISPSEFASQSGNSLVDYLTNNYAAYVYDDNGLAFPGNAGLIIAALSTVDAVPSDVVDALGNALQPDGSFATEAAAEFTSGAATDLSQGLAILGLSMFGWSVPEDAVNYLLNRQIEDGTWDSGFGPDLDTTAIVTLALLNTGSVDASHPAVVKVMDQFKSAQLENGLWKPGWDSDPFNVDTTGWVIQTLLAAGEDLSSWQVTDLTLSETLLTQQLEDGSIGGTYVNAYSTVEALLGLASIPVTSLTQSDPMKDLDPIKTAVDYLSSQQLEDGGMAGLAGTSDAGTTARTILALTANGIDPIEIKSAAGNSLVDFLTNEYPIYVSDQSGLIFPGNVGLVLAALGAVDQAPQDLMDILLLSLKPDGSFATEAAGDFTSGAATDLSQALAILGLANANVNIPSEAVAYLLERQAEDGSWDSGFGPDLDTTAISVIALIGSGQVDPSDAAIQKAFENFRSNQLDNAGWKPVWDTDAVNVDTTGWILQALITAGEDLSSWGKSGVSPLSTLYAQQQPDGSIGGLYVNAYSTSEALLGLAKKSIVTIPASVESPEIEEGGQVALVIQLAEGNLIQECIEITESEFSGADVLSASSLSLEIAFDPSMGSMVCGIEGVGCAKDDCFCDMPNYWSYWTLENETWAYAQTGADTLIVANGDVHGWSYGEAAPPVITFDQVCGEAAIESPSVESVAPTTETEQTAPTQVPEPSQQEEAEKSDQTSTYIVFGVILVVLLVVIFFVLRRKK